MKVRLSLFLKIKIKPWPKNCQHFFLVNKGPRQVAIASECPEVLNNLDIIGIGPSSPMYLNPACDQNVQPLFESPTTSTGCNQTLLELTPQRNSE